MKKITPSVIGHRGAAAYAPENTCSGFEAAAGLGIKWVEFDVRLTRDKQAIVFHDEDLGRTTNGRGVISDLDWKDISQYDAGSWFDDRYSGEKIPMLENVISSLQKLKLGANVEIKASAGREYESGQLIAVFLKKHWPESLPPVLVSSFMPACILAVKEEAPDISRALIVNEIPYDWEAKLQELGCQGLHCRHDKLNKKLAEQITGRGFSLRCFTVNNYNRAELLFKWGVESVFTDYPDRILSK
jgi:glycerophosphoryl diester phosphodiesterase